MRTTCTMFVYFSFEYVHNNRKTYTLQTESAPVSRRLNNVGSLRATDVAPALPKGESDGSGSGGEANKSSNGDA